MKKQPTKHTEGQISALHEGDAFGELQGELREGAEEAGFQQQTLLNRLDLIDEQHAQQFPQNEAAESTLRRAGRRTRNRPEGSR